jgi:hypothetical protein
MTGIVACSGAANTGQYYDVMARKLVKMAANIAFYLIKGDATSAIHDEARSVAEGNV